MSGETEPRPDFKEVDAIRRSTLLAAIADVLDQLKSRDNEDPGRRDHNDGLMMAARVLQDRIGERDKVGEELDNFCVALDARFRENATRERVAREIGQSWEVRDNMDGRLRAALEVGDALAVSEIAFLAWSHGYKLPQFRFEDVHPA